MPYQTFPDEPGDSDSVRKLECLRLPRNLQGKSFLDIGCNEGFFCAEAKRRGADKVVGIDIDGAAIAKARQRIPDVEFRICSWSQLPAGKFDVILMASALQYERNPEKLAKSIYDRLDDEGLFVLECGAIENWNSECWTEVDRWDRRLRYPTLQLLNNQILGDFSVRYEGKSVLQRGDPIPRHVLHCVPYRPIVILCGGTTHVGKSTLSKELGRHGVPRISFDQILIDLAVCKYRTEGRLARFISTRLDHNKLNLLIDSIASDPSLIDEFVEHICSVIPGGGRMTFVEGYVFAHKHVLSRVVGALESRKLKTWILRSGEEATFFDFASTYPMKVDTEKKYNGRVDGLGGNILSGWCWRIGFPERIGIIIDVNGIQRGPYIAASFREDLRGSRVGDGNHSFRVDLHDMPLEPDAIIRVLVAGTEIEIPGSGLTCKELQKR